MERRLSPCLAGFILMVFFCACSEETSEKLYVYNSPYNGVYTARSSALPGARRLLITYNNDVLYGKDVHCEFTDPQTANFTLVDIIPGESRSVLAIGDIVESGGIFRKSGSTVTPGSVSYKYDITLSEGWLELNLTGVSLPPNPLSAVANWDPVPKSSFDILDGGSLHFHTAAWVYVDPTTSLAAESLLTGGLGSILSTMLRELTFHPDGNLTVSFAGLPDDLDIYNDLIVGNGVTDRPDSDWTHIPTGLVHYYATQDEVIIRPNSEMIMRRFMNFEPLSRDNDPDEENDGATDWDWILPLYTQLSGWFSEGIRFKLVGMPAGAAQMPSGHTYDGDVVLYMEKDQIDKLFPVLSLIPGLLPDKFKEEQPQLFNLVNNMLPGIERSWTAAETVQIGVFLNK